MKMMTRRENSRAQRRARPWTFGRITGGITALGIALVLCLGTSSRASADVTISVPTLFSSLINSGGDTFAVTGNLIIANGGSILCNDPASPAGDSACPIKITVTGDMVMKAGSAILAENRFGAGNGGNIQITVDGDMTLCRPSSALPACSPPSGAAGAKISSSRLTPGGGAAGNITITVGNFPSQTPVGIFTAEPGTQVLADAVVGSGGEITITAGQEMDVDGLVRSQGLIGGVSQQPRGGGPITLKSGCKLLVSADGKVSSEGRDPGADLVHLEGCEVVIDGLVQSIALVAGGHSLPVNPPNHCNNDQIAHPSPPPYTACVEIFGKTVTINSILPNKGEVSADGVRQNRAWIDVVASDSVTINNDFAGNYSIHANAATSADSFGGLITVKALAGTFASTGRTIQANATGVGSDGGTDIVQAFGNVSLNTSSIEARGPNGSNTRGGEIDIRSFNGAVFGNNTPVNSELDAFGGIGGSGLGQVALTACTANPFPGGTYLGAITPLPPVVTFPLCSAGVGPTPPAAFALQVNCDTIQCGGPPVEPCVKRGTKFNDLDNDGQPREVGEPGLPGWKIRAYLSPTNSFAGEVTTGADGTYEFSSLACGTYTFCEVLQSTWTQTFPAAVGGHVVSCAGLEPNPAIVLGPRGYKETLLSGVPSEGNDFGNHTTPPPVVVRGKTQGFWHNPNGHAILDMNNDGNLDTPVDIGGATRGFHVTTIAESDKILPPNSACVAGSPVIFPTPCSLSTGLNLGSLEVLAGQTLALTYNIGKIAGYSGQTLSALGCTPQITAPLTALGITASSTVNQVLTVANNLINGSTSGGSTTQAQAGAMNALLGNCVNKE